MSTTLTIWFVACALLIMAALLPDPPHYSLKMYDVLVHNNIAYTCSTISNINDEYKKVTLQVGDSINLKENEHIHSTRISCE